jgi:hypothetical protein
MADGKSEIKSFPVTNSDVEGLIDALSKMARKLPPEQWGLLLSILAAAGGTVEVGARKTRGKFSGIKVEGGVITDPADRKVEELRNQLRNAHMPGTSAGAPLGSMIVPTKPPKPSTPPKKSGG